MEEMTNKRLEGGETRAKAEAFMFAPAGTPRAAINTIADAINKALQQPDVVQRVNTAFLEPLFRNPDQMAETVKADKERYAKAVKISGAKVD